MISYSSPRRYPRKIFVTLEGEDADLFRKLERALGSERRAQNAIVMEGLIQKLRSSNQVSKSEIARVEKQWKTVTGVTKKKLESILSTL